MNQSLQMIRHVVGLLIFFISCSVYSQTTEICNDGKDNNADGKIDCNDSLCIFPVTVEKGCRCFDNIDNDGDGKIDPADTDCASYYGLTFVGSGSTCSIQPPPGTGFSSIAPPQTSSQNTADTPAKVVVGDMNGDGVPDVAVTSKWNSTLQVVATKAFGGFTPGEIMADFRTPGSKIFPGAGSAYVFEHEVLIADINKDKIGEVFAIASERGGSPNNAPVRYFLTGFTYKVKNLEPLFDAIDLGTDRPGNPGIADFDGDGKAEIYLKNRIYAAESGVLLADGGGNWDTQISSGPVAANMFGDTKLELVCGNFIYTVPSLTARTLQTLTVAKDMNTIAGAPKYYPKGFFDPVEYGYDHASTSSTADFDGDGFIDVLLTGAINCSGLEAAPCGTNVTTIFYWNVQKNTVQTYAPPDPANPTSGWTYGTGRINMGDATGDGKLDALFVAGNKIFCLGLDAGGTLVLQWIRTINDSLSGILSLTVYDFNNDGKPEVVYRDSQELVVADGPTGQTKIWSASCQSHTWTEGPVIADVNGDGNTDICITCYTNTGVFDPAVNTVQQQSLGQTRLYYSTTNAWLPTRKIWNQHPYYVTNINDNLTLPFPQVDPSLIFSNVTCPNGLPGPQRPLNLFMNQVPRLSREGCPEFPAPDLTFTGDTPSAGGIDTDGDGVYTPTVVVIPPICGDVAIKAYFNLINNGDLPITDNVPVSFFNGDPTVSPVAATLLYSTTLNIANLQVGQKLVTPTLTFNGPGTVFKLYIVIYNNGAALPIALTGQSTTECSIDNNMYSVDVIPDPFSATVEKIKDNFKCLNSAPDNGELRAHIFKGVTETFDYSPYSFQWYTGTGTTSPIPAPAGTAYNLLGRAEGTYTLVVTNVQKGCTTLPISMSIVRQGNDPDVVINVVSHQTKCSPANGELSASIASGETGFVFEWFDVALTPLGIIGSQATGLAAGSYVVRVSKDGCAKTSTPVTVNGPQVPDAVAQVLQHVVDCSNPNSGSIQADAVFNGVVQDPANYTFSWFFYNNASTPPTRGGPLPGANGTGQTRTGLAAGYYQAEILDNLTKCKSSVFPVVQVQTQTLIPTAQITQVAPQTSCDPLNPNGILIADALISGVVQSPSTITFQWFKGQNTLPANLVSTTSGINGQTVNNVAGGGIPYTVKITTSLNCTGFIDFTIAENKVNPVVSLTTLPNTVCDPLLGSSPYSGSASAAVTFAGNPVTTPDANYKFTWYNGAATTDPVIAVADNKVSTLGGLKEGDYTVIVERTDLKCVSTAQTKPVVKATVLPALSLTSTGSNICDPLLTPDGTATAAVTNAGADSFTYKWFAGATIAGTALTTGANSNNGDQATAVKLGGPTPPAPFTYTVLVTNQTTGCQSNQSVLVADVSVVPVLSWVSIVPNSICSPATNFNGSLTTQIDNIPALYTAADYTFKWYNGNSNASPVNTTSTTTLLNKLDAGFYTVDVKNTKTGCQSAPYTNQVPNAKIFPVLVPAVVGSNNCNPALTPDGTASVSISNAGSDTFSFQWYTGGAVTPGSELPAANNGTSATAIKVGGPTGAPNSYTVLVTNNNTGCTNFAIASVPDISVVPVLSFINVTPNSICSPATNFNGSLTAQVNNIPALYTVADYTFKWYNGNSNAAAVIAGFVSPLLDKRDAGFYTVDAINTKTGCQSSAITDQVPDLKIYPAIQITSTGSNTCDPLITPDGTITATITNAGTSSFSYLWTAVAPTTAITVAANNADQATAIKVGGPTNAPNSYNVVVTNTGTGCVSNQNGMVADISQKPTFTLTPNPNTVCDITVAGGPTAYDGNVVISAVTHPQLGTSGITYKWFNADPITGAITGPNNSSTTTTLSQLDNGKFAATVTIDALGCTSDPLVREVLDALVIPNVVATATPNVNCYPAIAANGTAQITSVDGGATTNYFINWFNGPIVSGASISTADQLGTALQGPSSTYTAQAINKTTGCAGNQSVTVVDAQVTPTIAVSLTQNNTVCDITLGGAGNPTTYNGALLATPASMGTNFTISWVGSGVQAGTNGVDFTQLAVGAYSATVKNNDTGCVSSADSKNIIDVLTYPVITVAITPQSTCSGTPNGQLAITPVAGDTYVWFDDVGMGTAHTPAGNTISQLIAEDYTVRATTDATGCRTIQTKIVSDQIIYPTLSFTGVNPVTKCNSPDGTATVAIANLSAPTSYDIFYVFNSTLSGSSYPTDPADVKGGANPDYVYSNFLNQNLAPTARTGMIPGYLTALVIDKNTLCESIPRTQQIIDNTVKSNITLLLHASPGICGTGLGGIDPTVGPLAAAAYTYEWFRGAPTNTNPVNFFNNQPTFDAIANPPTGGNPKGQIYTDNGANLGINHSPVDNTISPATYTLVIRDPDGCGTYKTDNVPTSTVPVINIVPTDITRCDTGNGQMVVTVTSGSSGSGYSLQVFSGNNDTGTSKGSIPLSPVGTPLTVMTLDEGPYFIKLIDGANPTCPLGKNQTLIKKVLPPIITIAQIDPNTSCDPSVVANGKVNLTVTNANGDIEPKEYDVFNIDPVVTGLTPGTGFDVGNGDSGQSTGLMNGFKPASEEASYTITIKDDISKCESDIIVSIPDVQSTPSVLNILPTPETACAPLSNGSAVASLAGGESTGIFSFTWAQNNDLTSAVYTATGDGSGTTGELINQAHATLGTPGNFWPMGTALLGSGNRTFYVQGIKNNPALPGFGCKTEIKQVVILDQHVTPDMTLTPAFDSFCLATAGNNTIGDGTITIVADADPSTGAQNIPAAGFNYSWTPVPISALPVSPVNNSLATHVIGQLHDGNYTVTVTNATNGCSVQNAVTIAPAPYVITVDNNTLVNQRICLDDGRIKVTQVTLKDNSAGGPNTAINSDTDAPGSTTLQALYDFSWYADAGLVTKLNGVGTTPIVAQTLSNDSDMDGTVNETGDFVTMGAGTYYVVATRNDPTKIGFGCPSLPRRVDVQDVHVNPLAQLTPISNTSCLPAGPGEGEIKINVTDATLAPFNAGTYSYVWDAGNPQVIAPSPTNNGNGVSTDGDGDHPQVLLDGTYKVTINNNRTGCSVLGTTTIIKNATPVFVQNVTVADQVLCAADGSILVTKVSLNDRAGVNQDFVTGPVLPQGDIANFNFEWRRTGNPFVQTTTAAGGNVLNTTTYNAGGFGTPIGAGTYTVTAIRNTGAPGAGCKSAPFQVVIQNKQIFPVVQITPFANTSCDPLFFEGEVKVKVTDGSINLPAPLLGSPFVYNYNWTTSATPGVINGAIAGTHDGDQLGTDGDGDNPLGLSDGAYTLQVRNTQTNCISTGSTTIFKNSTPVFTQLVTPTDQVLCAADGRLIINEVKVIDRDGVTQSNLAGDFPLSDFDFEWNRTTATNLIATGDGALGNVSGGTILDQPFYNAIGADTYYVVAKRVAGGPGRDCESAPYKVDILNKQLFPVVSLTPFANTSCDPLFFEGEIKVKVTDASINRPPSPVPPYVYTYNWTTSATPGIINGAIAGTHDGDQIGTDGDGDNPLGLKDGAYTLQVMNTQTSCIATGSTTIFKNSTPIFVASVTSLPQIICNPDGQLEVTKIEIVDRNGNKLVSGTNFPMTDFDFQWNRNTIAFTQTTASTTLNVGNYNASALPGGFGVPLGADNYTVIARRISGGPGTGCFSAPFKATIDDQRLYPTATFTSLTNSSCNVLKPNGSVTTFAAEQNGTNTGPYTFAWTLNGGALSPATVQADVTNSSVLTFALDGNYVMTTTNTVTGCPFTTNYNLVLDQTKSTPNVIDVSTVDPLDCNPSASASVTKITIGSQTNSLLFPPNIPPNNEVTGAALNPPNFNYEWASGTPSNIIVGSTAPTITALTAGNYFVSVIDNTTDCKSGPKEVFINDDLIVYPVAEITQTAKQISCLATVGTAALAATGDGQNGAPYAFTWFPSLDNTGTPINPSSVPTITNLTAGNYSVTVLNTVTNCSSDALYVVPDDAPAFTPVVSIAGQPRTLCVGQDGAVIARVINLDPTYPFPLNYTADMFNGATPNLGGPPTVPNMAIVPGFPSNFIQSNLIEGFYTVRVLDNNTGCFGVATGEVQDKRTPPVIVIEEDFPMTNCDPIIANGQLSATADGQTGSGYTFDWYSGATVSTPVGPLIVSNNKLIGQRAGTYVVRVTTPVTGCTSDKSGIITDKTVIPHLPTAVVVFDRTNCVTPNGWVTANVEGVTFNYTFNWYNGTAVKPAVDFSGIDYQNIDIGTYAVTATDQITGCVSPAATAPVADKRVIPQFTFETLASYCSDTGKPKGIGYAQMNVTNSGDVFIDDVQWYDIGTNANVGSGVQVFELFPGFYRAEAVTTEGCTNEGVAEVKTEISPYNGVSSNGDAQNDAFIVDCITNFPNNNVKIFNRSGTLVYEIDGYNNADRSFRGHGEEGLYLSGKNLPVGTYFYIIDKRDGSKPVAGYLELDR